MKNKKTNLKKLLIPGILFGIGLALVAFITLAQASCPANTTVGETHAVLVGEVTNDGGDPNLQAWFQYGKTTSYGLQTPQSSKNGIGNFCATIQNLDPCTTYNFRAVAKNSAGTVYGGNQNFTTQCLPVSVNIKANNSNGPITVSYNSNVNLNWTSQNAVSCQASGDWSGSKSVSGSQTIQMNQVKTYTFTLTCQDSTGTKTSSDSVTVHVNPNLPTVITKPAVVTY